MNLSTCGLKEISHQTRDADPILFYCVPLPPTLNIEPTFGQHLVFDVLISMKLGELSASI